MSTPRALLHNPADVGDIGPGGVDLPLSWPLRCLSIRNPWRSSRYYPLLVFDNGLKLRWIRFESEVLEVRMLEFEWNVFASLGHSTSVPEALPEWTASMFTVSLACFLGLDALDVT